MLIFQPLAPSARRAAPRGVLPKGRSTGLITFFFLVLGKVVSTTYGVNLQLAERVDHFAVLAVVDIGYDNDVSLITRKPRVYDAAARDDPDKRDEFQRRIGEIPPVPSNFGPERHEQVLLKCLRLVSVDVLPLPVEKKRIPWMSNASWELVASKRSLLKKMKCMRNLLRIQDMRVCWLSGRSACGRCRPPFVPSLALVRQLALLSRDICDRTVEIRRSLKEDYAAHIQNIVGEAVSAARVLYSLVKRLKRQKPPFAIQGSA